MPRNCEERIKKDPPIMHVIERVLDRFQEGCSGCVERSIGPIVGQIKWDLLVFKGASEIPSGFTGSRPPNFPSRYWSCQSDTDLLPAGSRCVPSSLKVVSELSPYNRAVNARTTVRAADFTFESRRIEVEF